MVTVSTTRTKIRTVEICVRERTVMPLFPDPKDWDREKKRNKFNLAIGDKDPEKIKAGMSTVHERMNPKEDQIIFMCVENGIPIERVTLVEAEEWLMGAD